MSKRTTVLLIEDMLEAMTKVERYITGYDFDRFITDERTSDAVVRNLEIIGEAAARLSPDTRDSYSEVPWKKIIGLRNRIVHEYFGVDLEIVWRIIQNDLPSLKSILQYIQSNIK